MTNYRSGELILVAFPFSDGNLLKRRPALVLKDTGDNDLIVARVTSQSPQSPYDIEIKNWQDAGLHLPSIVRIHKVATIEKLSIERLLGTLNANDWKQMKAAIKQLWSS